jgi:hypothetical protein
MPATRNILGHVEIQTAKKKRKCHTNSSHEILPGQKHLAIETNGTRENVCLDCAPKVLNVASEYLKLLSTELFKT